MKKGQHILITGANGFVGAKLRRRLSVEMVTCLDRSKHSFFEIETLQPLLQNVSVVYHLAGVNAGSGFEPESSELSKNNIEATYNLLKAIRCYCTKPPLVVVLSTIHVYKKASKQFDETSELGPTSVYGMSKLAQEILIRQATEMGFIRSIVFRASNIYGTGCRPNYNSAIATFFNQIRENVEIPLFSNGRAMLDILYIDDVINCLLKVHDFEKGNGGIYNLASGNIITVEKIIKVLTQIYGKNIKTKMINSPLVEFSVSIAKLRADYPEFSPISIDEGLKRIYEAEHEV